MSPRLRDLDIGQPTVAANGELHKRLAGAGLEGTILEIGRDPKTNATPTRGMMKGVRVVVEGSGGKWEQTTDDQGWFRFWGLPAGEYTVRTVLPRNFVPEATTRRNVSINPSACGWVHMLGTPYA